MADALFDTTVFIDFYRGDSQAKSLIEAVLDGELSASVSAITSFELWMGIISHEEEMDYRAVLDLFEEVPLRGMMAQQAARWIRGLSGRQSETLFRDALIAASAADRDESIYTRNVRDFERFYSNVRSY